MPTYQLPDPEVKFLNKDDKFQLLSCYATPEIIVPKGFISDGNSAPWWARIVFPRYGADFPACIVHDWCYGGEMSRKRADQLLRKNMLRLGINPIRTWIMYLALRVGGHGHYQRRQEQDLSECMAETK